MERIRLALFSDRPKADPLQRRLAEAGIPAEVHEELGMTKFWFVSRATAGARLEVPAAQAERATQLLLCWDIAQDALQGAIRCPDCGSLRVEYPQVTRKSILPNILMGLLAGVGLLERDYYCEECHCMWTKPTKKSATPNPSTLT